MRKLFMTVVQATLALTAASQTTDSVDHIVLRIPSVWQINKQQTFTELKYTSSDKKYFCQIAVYQAVAARDQKSAFQTEWKELVEKNFTVFTLAEPTLLKTKQGSSFQRLGAKALDRNGNKYYVQLNVYDCGSS